MRRLVLAGCLVAVLGGCMEGTQPTAGAAAPDPSNDSYYLNHQYVQAAMAQGNRAIAAIRAGDAAGAQLAFQQSTTILAQGIDRHRVLAAERADAQRVGAALLIGAVTVAGMAAAADGMNTATNAGQVQAIADNLDGFVDGMSSVASFIGEQIDLGEISITDGNASYVARDQWRSIVVSDDPLAQSIVRIRNQTMGGWCTGFFIAPHVIMTAAHCFDLGDALGAFRQNPNNGRNFMTGEDEFIEILMNAQASSYRGVTCDPYDVALLVTDRPSRHWLTLATSAPRAGQQVMGLGYSGDLNAGFFLRTDYGCRINGVGALGQISHDCGSYPGNSGGPIMSTAAGRLEVLGVHSCGPRDVISRAPGRFAANAPEIARQMLAAMRESPLYAPYLDRLP